MHWLSTGLSALFAFVALLAVITCNRHASRVERRRRAFEDGIAKLHSLRTELDALADAQESTTQQLHRLRGKFYRKKQDDGPRPLSAGPETADQVRARLRSEHGLPRVGPRPLSAGNSE